jgi:Tfp pilus assembly protein PilX
MSYSVSLLPHRSLLKQSYPWERKISTAWMRSRGGKDLDNLTRVVSVSWMHTQQKTGGKERGGGIFVLRK